MKPEEMRDDIPLDVREALEQHIQFGGMDALMAILRPKPKTVRLEAVDLPAPLTEVPENKQAWVLSPVLEGGVERAHGVYVERAIRNSSAFAAREDAEAWLAHLQSWKRPGADWAPHTPGDPMPCDGKAVVEVRYGAEGDADDAENFDWGSRPGYEITGWRYAREES